MFRYGTAVIVILCALCAPERVFGQTVTLGAPLAVASARDFATESFQDPWDMNQRTDFGWFLNGADQPLPDMSNVSFSGGIFSATTGNGPNLFLLETGVTSAARIGKTGLNYPIDANTYRLFAIRMSITPTVANQATLSWNRNDRWDGTFTTSNTFAVTPGVWRTYLIDLPTLGTGGSTAWSGLIRSLQFNPSFQTTATLNIDWIRLVDVNPALCRQVTWTVFPGAVDLYLQDSVGNQTLLAPGVTNNKASNGCSPSGSGYNFYAGALAPGSYHVLARPAGSSGAFTTSGGAYLVNDTPTLTMTSPSDEGSADDFATTVLGKAWDMTATTDVDQFINVTNQQIAIINAETPAGTPLPNTRVLWAASTPAQPPNVGDPQLYVFSTRALNGARIDPTRYRILTAEFGLPDTARGLAAGSIGRIVWRVAGETAEGVSDDLIFSSRLGANVLDKVSVDMADRTVLPIVQGSPTGWVPGTSAQPGIDRLRFKPHEFSPATTFFIKRVKLAALERVTSGSNYTIAWTASKPNGTVTLYYDTDRDPTNGKTLIGSAPTSAGTFVWTAPNIPLGEYFIYAQIDDGQGNSNGTYARWPIIVGHLPPSAPAHTRIQH